jgi:hypothetical protein
VDRAIELDKVEDFVHEIEAKIADHFILNFFALAGFGKTALLRRIWELYERLLPASFVDIGGYLKKGEEFDLCRSLVDMIRQLDERIPKRLKSLPVEFDRSTDEMWLAEQLLALIQASNTYGKVVLLLLDDYDRMPARPRAWFEAKILSQAIRTGQVAAILTSELELRFTERIDLRMRLESYKLSSFTEQIISQSFPRYKSVASDILRLTGGLPVCTEHLVQYLDNLGISTQAEFRAHERELVRQCYRTYVEETVFHDLDQALRDTILVLALLRRFDVAVLKELLPKVLPDYYKGSTKVDYFDLIDSLGNRVQWRQQGGYTLNQGLQTLIEAYTLAQRPKIYEQVNRAALALYRKELKTTKEYREHYLLELLYHKLALLELVGDTTPVALQKALGEELRQYLGGESKTGPLPIEDLDSLRNSLLQDQDLKDYVSEDILHAIQDQIDAQSGTARVILFRADSR